MFCKVSLFIVKAAAAVAAATEQYISGSVRQVLFMVKMKAYKNSLCGWSSGKGFLRTVIGEEG